MSEGSDGTTLVVDLREPDLIRNLTLAHPDVDDWLESHIDAADIVVNGVGIERKTPSDFASAMTEDRLDEQVRKLTEMYDNAAILLEGGFDDFEGLSHSRLKPQSARGKAASVHQRHGIPVVPTGGRPGSEEGGRLLVDYAVRLGRKATEEPSSDYLRGTAVGSDEPAGKRMWAVLEGVGPTRAGDLYDAVGSPVDYATQPPDDRLPLSTVDGIGQTTAGRIMDQLRRDV